MKAGFNKMSILHGLKIDKAKEVKIRVALLEIRPQRGSQGYGHVVTSMPSSLY
jgi:hypothetical protein